MKAEWKLFGFLTAFVVVVTPIYAWWTDNESGGVEWVGTVALVLTGLLCMMCAAFFWIVSRRIDPRPEDRTDGEIIDGAGELGFFSPGSYWPFGIALSGFVTALGMAYMQIWLIATGIIAILLSSGGLLFEYYTGSRRGAEH